MMKKTSQIAAAILLALSVQANEPPPSPETEAPANQSAIPPQISPDDPELKFTIREQTQLLNAKKADYIIKDVRVGGQKIPSVEKKAKERILREKFDSNPRQTIPLKECIKPNGVIDNEVNECMNGRIKNTWKEQAN